tara:strand:+ start:3410 stop:3751 length:342 start_codon:yes stop_codon:yes gene_type:complete
MCVGPIANLFGGGRSTPAAPPTPAPPTTPPPPMPIQQAPTPLPDAPTPVPISEDETKRKAKVTAKKVAKKGRGQAGTSRLATKKPATGGLRGIQTGQGTNTGSSGSGSSGGSY